MSDEQLAVFRRVVNTYPPHWAEETDALQAALQEIESKRDTEPDYLLLEG